MFTSRTGEHLRTMYDIIVLVSDRHDARGDIQHRQRGNCPGTRRSISRDRHSLSHHNGDKDLLQQLTRSDEFNVQQFAYFLDRLAEVRDGTGLLDTTVSLYGSGSVRQQPWDDQPTARTGGRGQARFVHGSHVDFNRQVNGFKGYGDGISVYHSLVNSGAHFSNLLLTIAQRMGVDKEAFADSNAVVSEVQRELGQVPQCPCHDEPRLAKRGCFHPHATCRKPDVCREGQRGRGHQGSRPQAGSLSAGRGRPPQRRPRGQRSDESSQGAHKSQHAKRHYFAMLPYGMVWYHGAPADIRDTPPGTHMHGRFLLPLEGRKTIPISEERLKQTPTLRYNHAILLEDDAVSIRAAVGRGRCLALSRRRFAPASSSPSSRSARRSKRINKPALFDIDDGTGFGKPTVGRQGSDQAGAGSPDEPDLGAV